jgi:hypothetical protein
MSKDARLRYVEIVCRDISLVISRFTKALSFGGLTPGPTFPRMTEVVWARESENELHGEQELNVDCLHEFKKRNV